MVLKKLIKISKKFQFIIAIFLSAFLLVASFATGVKEQIKKNEIKEKYLANYDHTTVTRTLKCVRIEPQKVPAYIPPKSWKRYKIVNTFNLCIPATIELRKSSDKYSRTIKKKKNVSTIVFQQKGLGKMDSKAYKTYCRIMVNFTKGNTGDFIKSTEYKELNSDNIHYFQEAALLNCNGYELLGKAEVHWIKIENTYGIEVEYIRNGTEKEHTCVHMYYFFNDNKLAIITLSYRQRDADKWKKNFSQIIKTFSWNKPNVKL